MFATVHGQLVVAEILPKYRHHEVGVAVISLLLKKGSITEKEYTSLMGSEIGRKLLGENVFSFSYKNRLVSFRSTLMKRYFEKESDWK